MDRTTPLRERLAASVRRLRKERGWGVLPAALALGLNPRHLHRIEKAEMNVTLATLELLCRGYEVDVAALFAEPPALGLKPVKASEKPRRRGLFEMVGRRREPKPEPASRERRRTPRR